MALKRPRLWYSATVGIFPSLRATTAQSSSTVDSRCRKPRPLGRSPASSIALVSPPKCLCSASSETRAAMRSSRRLGLCLSFLAHERMAWRISTRDMAFFSWEGFSGKSGYCLPIKLRSFWATGVLRDLYGSNFNVDNTNRGNHRAKLLIPKD